MNRLGIVGDSTLQENTTMQRQTYTPEIKERAVRMLIEAANDYPSIWSAIQAIAPKIGCTPDIVGWKVSNRMNTNMVMSALNQAIADRNNPKDVIHHSDRGVQYLSIRYTDKMTDSGVIASVGTTGDSYDNALAETVNGLYKTEVIEYLKQQWQGVSDVELATLEWVDWFKKTRIHSTIGYVSPFGFERRYYDSLSESDKVA